MKTSGALQLKTSDELPEAAYCSGCYKLYEEQKEQCSRCYSPLQKIKGFILPNGRFLSVGMKQKVENIVTEYLDERPKLHDYHNILRAIRKKVFPIDNPLSFESVMILFSKPADSRIIRRGNFYYTKLTVNTTK